ncbi:hypothetical protein EYR36_009922 [Pleurotus pulmonarius]|nr:hypothetical protein EYR36_009922 [Pleurotus pulmonarius]KAF4593400.1 hypothetical protein EYR38_009114 [Pleurotus pulmonarius]
MNNNLQNAPVHAIADNDQVNYSQRELKKHSTAVSMLDDVLPESYERTYIPDTELQLPARVAPQPRNQQRAIFPVAGSPPNINEHPPLPIGPSTVNGGRKLNGRHRTVRMSAQVAAKPAKDRSEIRRATYDGPNKASSINSEVSFALKGSRKDVDAGGEGAKENPSPDETSGTDKKSTRRSARNAEKLRVPKVEEVESDSAVGPYKRKSLHKNTAAEKCAPNERVKKNKVELAEDKPKIILRVPKRQAQEAIETFTKDETVERNKVRREEVVIDESKLKRGSRNKQRYFKKRPQ